MPDPKAKVSLKSRNDKAAAGIKKHLSNVKKIVLSGKTYTAATLIAVFQADSNAMAAADAAEKTREAAVLKQKEAHLAAKAAERDLKRYLLAQFGDKAVDILGDFGFTPPRGPTTTVKIKAAAQDKAAATRAAGGTKAVKKKATTAATTSEDTAIPAQTTPPPATGTTPPVTKAS